MAREIPGFWRDPSTGKYFKIGPGFKPPAPSSLEPIKTNPNYPSLERSIRSREVGHFRLGRIRLVDFIIDVKW